jgi:tRNA uridine 5-carboxymethylaminomethyl modification enzyme
MLNKSKGPAMVAKSSKRPYAFAEEWRLMLEGTQTRFYQEMVNSLIIEKKIKERTALGIEIKAKSVVLTNGTFQWSNHIGDKTLVVEERARVLRMESLKI